MVRDNRGPWSGLLVRPSGDQPTLRKPDDDVTGREHQVDAVFRGDCAVVARR